MGEKEEYTLNDPSAPQNDDVVVEKISEELNVNLPGQNLPLPIRLIAYFTLIGGLSIVGSLFTDIVRPQGENPIYYVVRIAVGVLAIFIAYGILERKRWSIWLYGFLALIALNFNLFLAIIPLISVIYLILNRTYFTPSQLDKFILLILSSINNPFKGPPSSQAPVDQE